MITKLWPYVLGSVVLGLDAYVIAGLLPTIATDLDATAGMVGIGVAGFTAAYAVVGPILAGAAGRSASRSLFLALVVFVIANIGSAFAVSVGLFIFSRVVAGAAAGIFSPLSSSVAAASVPAERRGRALSLVLAGLACGTVFGVPVGLLVAHSMSWRWTFGLIAAVGLIATIGISMRGKSGIADVAAPSLRARLVTLTRGPNVVTMLVTLLTGVSSLGLYTYFLPLLDGLGLSHHKMWLIWVWGIGGAVGALLVGRVVDAVPRPLLVTVFITALLAVTFALLGWNVSVVVSAMCVFAWGVLGWSSLAPQQHTLITANPADGTTAVAANASANYMGSALGASAGAVVIDAGVAGAGLAFIAVVPAVIACILQLFRIRMARA